MKSTSLIVRFAFGDRPPESITLGSLIAGVLGEVGEYLLMFFLTELILCGLSGMGMLIPHMAYDVYVGEEMSNQTTLLTWAALWAVSNLIFLVWYTGIWGLIVMGVCYLNDFTDWVSENVWPLNKEINVTH